MATWMMHFRICDALIEFLSNVVDREQFCIGNIAPDSGAMQPDGTWAPPKDVTHFRRENAAGKKNIEPETFAEKYLALSTPDNSSFLLGYYAHLVTDRLWSELIYRPTREKYLAIYKSRADFDAALKFDWYGQDFLFLRDIAHPASYELFCSMDRFDNTYLDFLAPDAITAKMADIRNFYAYPYEDIDREYKYLTTKMADDFVITAGAEVLDRIKLKLND